MREQFDGVQARVDFQYVAAAGFWLGYISARLLHLVAATDSAEAAVSDSILRIRGTSGEAATVQQQLALLRDALPAAMTWTQIS